MVKLPKHPSSDSVASPSCSDPRVRLHSTPATQPTPKLEIGNDGGQPRGYPQSAADSLRAIAPYATPTGPPCGIRTIVVGCSRFRARRFGAKLGQASGAPPASAELFPHCRAARAELTP